MQVDKPQVEPPAVQAESAAVPNEPVQSQPADIAEPVTFKSMEKLAEEDEERERKRARYSPSPRESVDEAKSHPVTPSLYISGLVRPFLPSQLKELLGEHGSVEYLWLDSVKSHCYVTVRHASSSRGPC